MRSAIALLVVVFFGLTAAPAAWQASKASSSREDILNYQLTLPRAEHLITAMEAMTRYVVSLPDYKDRLRKSATMTPADVRARMEKDPKAMAILKENGLTAQEYLVGVPALRMALMAAQGLAGPTITVSPANLAFAKANLAQLKPKMDAADSGVGRK